MSLQTVLDLFAAFHRTVAVKAGVELDVFTAIAEGVDTPAALAARCLAGDDSRRRHLRLRRARPDVPPCGLPAHGATRAAALPRSDGLPFTMIYGEATALIHRPARDVLRFVLDFARYQQADTGRPAFPSRRR